MARWNKDLMARLRGTDRVGPWVGHVWERLYLLCLFG